MRYFLVLIISIAASLTAASLHEAVLKGGHTLELKSLLSSTIINVNAKNEENQTALHVAVSVGNYEACHLLIEAGADLNSEDETKATPLFYATYANNVRLVNLLLKCGANVNHKDEDGKVIWHIAAEQGYAEIFEAIIINCKKLIEAKMTDNKNWTVVHYAASKGRVNIIDILTYSDISKDDPDANGMTPLHLAIAEGYTEVAVRLVDIDSIYFKKMNCSKELRLAVQHGNVSVLYALMNFGCDIEAPDDKGNTVLLNAVDIPKSELASDRVAAFSKSANIVKILILSGADLEAVNDDGKNAADLAMERENYAAHFVISVEMTARSTGKADLERTSHWEHSRTSFVPDNVVFDHLDRSAVHLAVEPENLEAVRELISAKCDISSKNALGNTALHAAKSTEMVRLLLHADPKLADISNNCGELPLHMAVKNAWEDGVAILAAATTNVDAVNIFRRCPLDLAVELNNVSATKSLLKNGAKGGQWTHPLHVSAFMKNVEITKMLLAYGWDTTSRNKGGLLPAHHAVRFDNIDMIRITMKGVKPDDADIYGHSLLFHATGSTRKVVKMLIEEYGVPLDLGSYQGWTALHAAAIRANGQVLQTLIDYGANPLATTSRGKTAMHYAIWNLHEYALKCVSILTYADRKLLTLKNDEGISPVDYILKYTWRNENPSINNKFMAAMELTVADIPKGKVKKALQVQLKSFVIFLNGLREIIPFEEYVERGMDDFKRLIALNDDEKRADLKDVIYNIGVFYAFAAAHYPKLASKEVPKSMREEYRRKKEDLRERVSSFEKFRNKVIYMKELRCMLVDAFMRRMERLEGTYMISLPQELIDDSLVDITNNNRVWERMELVANALMLNFNKKEEMEPFRRDLSRKMALLSKEIIPKRNYVLNNRMI